MKAVRYGDMGDTTTPGKDFLHKLMIKQAWVRLFVFIVMYYAVVKTRPAIEAAENAYSMRHNDFNKLFLNCMIKLTVMLSLGMQSMRNFNLRLGSCLDKLFLIILILIRLVFMSYLIYELVPGFFDVAKLAFYMNKENSWVSKENEPFITNCSYYNAAACWFFWTVSIIYLYVALIGIPFVLFVGLVT